MHVSEFIVELRMGVALLDTQAAEACIKKMVAGLLPDGESFDAESYRENIEKDAKTPLGPLIKKLREKITISSEFETELSSFLVMRNKFIHHFLDQPGVDISTKDGRKAAQGFLVEYAKILEGINGVLAAVGIAVSKQYNLRACEFENDEWYLRTERDFLPKVEEIFSKKGQ